MKNYATLSELVSGVRFALVVERMNVSELNPDFANELEKAEASAHPKELQNYAIAALQNCKFSVTKTVLNQVSSMAAEHPLFDRPFEIISDDDIKQFLVSLPSEKLVTACRACNVLVDHGHLRDSAEELARLSSIRLLTFMPSAELSEVESLNRLELFAFAVEHFVWVRHVQKIDDFLKTALSEKQRDDLMASLGVDITDEDYETDMDENISAELVATGLDVLQDDADWVDWSSWTPEDPTLDVFEALKYSYEKLTPETAKSARDALKDN